MNNLMYMFGANVVAPNANVMAVYYFTGTAIIID